jgi:hypothetical protein
VKWTPSFLDLSTENVGSSFWAPFRWDSGKHLVCVFNFQLGRNLQSHTYFLCCTSRMPPLPYSTWRMLQPQLRPALLASDTSCLRGCRSGEWLLAPPWLSCSDYGSGCGEDRIWCLKWKGWQVRRAIQCKRKMRGDKVGTETNGHSWTCSCVDQIIACFLRGDLTAWKGVKSILRYRKLVYPLPGHWLQEAYL